MLMRRLNPAFPLGDLRREWDRLFKEFNVPFSDMLANAPERGFPAVNVWEDQESIFVEAEVPGLKLADLELTVVGNELSIRGERKPCSCAETAFHRQERGMGRFARFFTLPAAVEPHRVEAVLRDGILTVTLPKAAESKPRRIEVKAN